MVTFAATRLRGSGFKPRPGQKFETRFLLHSHPSGGEGVSSVQGEAIRRRYIKAEYFSYPILSYHILSYPIQWLLVSRCCAASLSLLYPSVIVQFSNFCLGRSLPLLPSILPSKISL